MKKVVVVVFAVLMMCGLAFGQGRMVAVCVIGDGPDNFPNFHSVMKRNLRKAINLSNKYKVISRDDEVSKLLTKERVYQYHSGNVDPNLRVELEREFGVQYLCIANVERFGKKDFNVEASIVDVETALLVNSTSVTGLLRTDAEVYEAARVVVEDLLNVRLGKSGGGRPVGELGKWMRRTAVGLDIAGAGAVAYGLYKNSKMHARARMSGVEKKEIDGLIKERDAYYVVGGMLLGAGITVHIFF
jgi:hypothetical protein